MQATKPSRLIFKTLKAVAYSDKALSVADIEAATGLGERTVQRHVAILSDIGMIRMISRTKGSGFLYMRNIKFVS